MGILQFIASRNYIALNKELIKLIGLEEAILLGELASEYDYWDKQNGLVDGGYFYSTIDNVENNTTLSSYQQRKALNKLKELGLVDVEIKGMPAKRYIRINEEEVLKHLDFKLLKNLITSCEKTKEQVVKKLKGNNNIYNKNNNNKKRNIKEKATLEDIEKYIEEKELNVDGKQFYDYFEEGNWIDSRGNKVKNWKQKLLTWNRYATKSKETMKKLTFEENITNTDLDKLYE